MKSFNFELARNVTIYENRQFENQYIQASKIFQPSNARYRTPGKTWAMFETNETCVEDFIY